MSSKFIFTIGNLISIILGLPVIIIGLIIGLIWGWYLVLWIGVGILAIGLCCTFYGLIVGAGGAIKEAQDAAKGVINEKDES